jgi:hypothetical protein
MEFEESFFILECASKDILNDEHACKYLEFLSLNEGHSRTDFNGTISNYQQEPSLFLLPFYIASLLLISIYSFALKVPLLITHLFAFL